MDQNFDSVNYGTNYGTNSFDIEYFHYLSVAKNKQNLWDSMFHE
jgi:hypothetical protein